MKWIVFFILPVLSLSLKLIPGLIRCTTKDIPCLKDAVQDALKKIAKGVPEPYNVQSIDPLLVNELNITVGSNAIVMNQYLKNTSVFGLSDVKITKVKLDWKNNYLLLEASFEKVIYSGQYAVDGKFLVFPVEGSGQFTADFHNGITKVKINWDIITKKNEKYFKIKDVNLLVEPSLLTLNFENLFGGNKLLSDNMNAVFNENWKVILEEVGPYYTEAYGQNVKHIVDDLVSKVPLHEMFLDFRD